MINNELLREEVKNYIDAADTHVLKLVHAMLKADSENDWWNELEEDEEASIKRGLNDLENGNIILHEDVIEKHSEWFSK